MELPCPQAAIAVATAAPSVAGAGTFVAEVGQVQVVGKLADQQPCSTEEEVAPADEGMCCLVHPVWLAK